MRKRIMVIILMFLFVLSGIITVYAKDPIKREGAKLTEPNEVIYDHWSVLDVQETITDLGGGQWKYSYQFTNTESDPIWIFFVWTTFLAGNPIPFNKNDWGATSDPIDDVYPVYDARNLDPAIIFISGTWGPDWAPDGCSSNSIMVGETATGFSFVADVYDPSPKYYGYEFQCSYAVNSGIISAVGLTGEVIDCEEDDTGALDIPGTRGAPGGTVTIPVRIQNAPDDVNSLGFEVFPPSVLTYTGYTRGPLVEDFDFFDCNVPADKPDVIRCGGFKAEGGIAAGASGDVVSLTFDVSLDCEGIRTVGLQELKDDIKTWSATSGCFDCSFTCDVNGDGEVTPQDALCAFQKYLGYPDTACGPAEEIFCDVTGDGDCTPADALEIFKEYLGLPSVCSAEPVE